MSGLGSKVTRTRSILPALIWLQFATGHGGASAVCRSNHLPQGTGVRAALDAACANAGFKPRVVLEASALPMVARLGGMGLGVAIMPASTPRSGDFGVRGLEIRRPQVRSRLELAWDPAAAP